MKSRLEWGGLPPISTLTSMLAKLGAVCVSSLAAFQARDTSKSTPRRRQERQQAARNGATAVQANEGIDAAAKQESGDMDGDAAAAQASGDVDSDAATSEW